VRKLESYLIKNDVPVGQPDNTDDDTPGPKMDNLINKVDENFVKKDFYPSGKKGDEIPAAISKLPKDE